MRTTIMIEKVILDMLMKETKSRSRAPAVKIAINEFLRKRKIEKIQSMRGKLEFDMTADEIRHRER